MTLSNASRDSELVGSTADGLAVVRGSDQASDMGVLDPHAALFVDDAGRRLAEAAGRIDKVYPVYNLARFRWSSERVKALLTQVRQVVLPGVGFDTRALWYEPVASARLPVFEVDTPAKLAEKARVLARHGIELPDYVHAVGADLNEADWPEKLREAGYDPKAPSLVLAEGVVFYLMKDSVRRLLSPDHVPFAHGSAILFDYWNEQRVDELNSRVRSELGAAPFRNFPWPGEPAAVEDALQALGWATVSIQSLETLASEFVEKRVKDEFPNSWLLVEARC